MCTVDPVTCLSITHCDIERKRAVALVKSVDTMAIGAATIVAFVALAASLLVIKDLRLPYPCFDPIVNIPAEHIPAPSDLFGPYTPNRHLQKAKKLFEHQVKGVETVSISPDGVLYMPDNLGRVWTSSNGGAGPLQELAYTGGKPLGGYVYPGGDAIFCDALKGVIQVNATGTVQIVTARGSLSSARLPGQELIFADDLDVASDGTVYFSTMHDVPVIKDKTGEYEALQPCLLNILQGSAQGRLWSYSPKTGVTELLADNIWQANGVAVAHDESFVLVASTPSMRLYRYWLKGNKAGSLEVFLDSLPGMPDGVSRASDGNYWVAVNSAPTPKALGVLMKSRFLRWFTAWVPLIKLNDYGLILKVSPKGKVLQSLHDPTGNISFITAVTEYNGKIYTGHLHRDYITVLDLNDVPAVSAQ